METHNRLIINDCEPQAFENLIARLKKNDELQLKKHKPAADGIFQERYSYTSSYEHISIVYETKSRTLIITAADHILLLLKAEFALAKDFDKSLAIASSVKAESKPPPAAKKPAAKKEKPPQKDGAKVQAPVAAKPVQSEQVKSAQPIQKPAPAVESKQKTSLQSPAIPAAPAQESKQKTSLQSQAIPAAPAQESKQAISSPKKPAAKKPAANKKTQTADNKSIDNKNTDTSALPAKENAPPASDQAENHKGGYTIKKISEDKLDEILKQIKTFKGVSYKLDADGGAGGKAYTIRDSKNKAYLRYFASRQSLHLQGKKSALFTGIQGLIEGSDYMSAVSSHIELTGEEKKAKELEKMLKKLLPVGFDFLSEQSRIDLTIGMMDINNNEVKLSDYSMLLVPPYRGLERLIFDLQQAQGLNVKMIGQAYEKTDGKYVLKSGYRKRVGSIVYAEVMSALYIEYFEKRNFYAHSDITGDRLSRVITDKAAVQTIFNNLIELIEYNVKKLKEIGFSM